MISEPIYPEYPCITEVALAKFQPTWLMVKRHKITGLQYFCKTVRCDPYSYKGSGTRWVRHIEKHGKEHVETTWCQLFDDVCSLVHYALTFSKENDIVASNDWANLMTESGLSGGGYTKARSPEEARKNRSKAHLGQAPWNKGLSMTNTQITKMRKPKSEAHKIAMRKPKNNTQNMKGPQRSITCAFCGFTDLCAHFTRYHEPICQVHYSLNTMPKCSKTEAWFTIKAMINTHGAVSFGSLYIAIQQTHKSPSKFIKRCIGNGWLKPVENEEH